MGKARIKTRTAYFVATPEGRLKKLNPLLLGLAGAVVLVLVIFVSSRCYVYNRDLMERQVAIRGELTRMTSEQDKLDSALKVCENKKAEISRLLYFTTDSESTGQTEKADEK